MLERRLAASAAQLARLRAELDEEGARPLDASEKIARFRDLFRGRADVFPARWENPKTRRSGYAPRCRNEW